MSSVNNTGSTAKTAGTPILGENAKQKSANIFFAMVMTAGAVLVGLYARKGAVGNPGSIAGLSALGAGAGGVTLTQLMQRCTGQQKKESEAEAQ